MTAGGTGLSMNDNIEANWKQRFSYLWTVAVGWAIFLPAALIGTGIAFWLGSSLSLLLGGAGVVGSVLRLRNSTKDVMIHGVTWTLAIALILLDVLWIYSVSAGI